MEESQISDWKASQLCHSGDYFKEKAEEGGWRGTLLERGPCPNNSTPSHLVHS